MLLLPGVLFLFCFQQSSALSTKNGSALLRRTFPAHFKVVADDPADYIDLSALGLLSNDEGSGSEWEAPVKRHEHHNPHQPHHPPHTVSEATKALLQGRLATVLVPTVYTLTFIVAVPLNLVALFLFVHHIRPRKPAAIYMLNLACADLLFGLLLPFKMAYHYHGNNWTYSSFMCRAVTAAFHCNMYCSVLLLMCISVDRFLSVVHPASSAPWRSPQTAWVVSAAMWMLSIGGVVPLLTSGHTVHLSDLGITTCHDVQEVGKLRSYYVYFFPIYSSIFFFIPLVFTAVCLVRVVQALAADDGPESPSRRNRVAVMAAVVLLEFVVCFAPTNVILMVHYVQLGHRSGDVSYRAYLLSTCLGSLSCCLDPLLYYLGSSQCQRRVAALLGRGPASQAEIHSETQSTTSSCRGGGRSCKLEGVETGTGRDYSRMAD